MAINILYNVPFSARKGKFLMHWRQRIDIAKCVFADDVALITGSDTGLREKLKMWKQVVEKYGMKMNNLKTTIMVIREKESQWK